jgi:D-Tyr-tRNAtyr deacylase
MAGAIGPGLLVLLGVEDIGDAADDAQWLAGKISRGCGFSPTPPAR